MLVDLGEDERDAAMRVHLKGHFLPLKHAGRYWRAESKAGRSVDGFADIVTQIEAGQRGR